MSVSLPRRLLAEALGTAFLLATVVGSGIMAVQLAQGNIALATGAMLVVLIAVLAPISGAHFNPAVSLMMALDRRLAWSLVSPYLAAQLAGAVLGVWLAHAMFGLVQTILGCIAQAPKTTPAAVGLYMVAAYWFTSSTSFANPAVTVTRALTDTFAGIAPSDAPAFIAAQLPGASLGLMAGRVLWPGATSTDALLPAGAQPPQA